jgi:general secretion pathway protein G
MNNIKRMRDERGFTLIELLVVIVILGILAAVVVFAISGLTDKGEGSSCKIDTRTIRTAEEAYYANSNSPAAYTNEAGLVPKFLAEPSKYHDVAAVAAVAGVDANNDGDFVDAGDTAPVAASYTITVQDAKCGTPGSDVSASATDNNI